MKMRLTSSQKLALITLVFGIIYVLFSDYLTLLFSGDNLQFYNRVQNYKGIVFIIVCSGLVYVVSKRLNADIDRANREQEEALKRYNVLGMATNDAVWDLNMKTGECFTNRTLQEIFGYTADELMDNNTWWTNNLHPEDKERVISTIDAKLSGGGTVWQDEYRFRCKDGSYKMVFDRGFIMRNKAGQPYRIIGAMQDVTEQRLLQQQLVDEKVKHRNEMAQNVFSAQEAERKKLGEELHDNINQLLGVVKLYIEHAQADPSTKKEMLKRSSEYLVQVIQEINSLSKSLTPPTLSDLGLLESIEELAAQTEDTKKISIVVDAEGLDDSGIEMHRQLMIYRIVQEQLNNIVKHAQAKNVTIQIRNLNQAIKLKIIDDGKGFDPVKHKAGGGFRNMRNKLEVFNGNMRIASAPGSGCVLEVSI